MGADTKSNAGIVERIEALIRGPQHAMPQAEKDITLTPILRQLCREMAVHCPAYGRFLDHFGGNLDEWNSPLDVPPLPTMAFKRFLLSAVASHQIVRTLTSSTTTGQTPSRIVIDKTTAFRQSRSLVSILKEHIGGRRRPFLVLDAADSVDDSDQLTARGAAIRGIATFASHTVFAFDKSESGDLTPNWPRIDEFFEKHESDPVLLFGFTFIVWTRFLLEAERQGKAFHAANAVLFHSGGWKKLAAQSVQKGEFSRRTATVVGCSALNILDFYGMVEQVGTVFVDCPAGNKHAPAFGDVILRRPGSLQPTAVGETGIIEVLSVLPSSYPGHALLTEDQGILLGVDDCPCGRKGKYFRFAKRIERTEIRGCGDTFAQSRELR